MTVEEKGKSLVEICKRAMIGEMKNEFISDIAITVAKGLAIVVCDEVISLLTGWPEPRDITITTEINRYQKIRKHIEDNY